MLAIELPEQSGDETTRITATAREQGLMLLSCGLYGNVIRILVPFSDRRRRARARPRHPRGLRLAADVDVVGGARKTYGDVVAVDDVDLDVADGEFFTLLGPSGSGKTTTLRMIAGFEQPDAGTITLGGEDITRRPPYARDVNTVFQDYALFPHMTVAENVGYGLKVKGVPRERARAQVERGAATWCGSTATAAASRCSSRAASASASRSRARSSTSPKVLLLDEPLGALDLKLRQEMQVFLKALQQRPRHDVPLRHARPGGGADEAGAM